MTHTIWRMSAALSGLALLVALIAASDALPKLTEALPPCVDGIIAITANHTSYVGPGEPIACRLVVVGITDVNITDVFFLNTVNVTDSAAVTIADAVIAAQNRPLTLLGTDLTVTGARIMQGGEPVRGQYAVLIDGTNIHLLDSQVQNAPWAVQLGRLESPIPAIGTLLQDVVFYNSQCPEPPYDGFVALMNVQGALLTRITLNTTCPAAYDIYVENGTMAGEIPLRDDTLRSPVFELAAGSEHFRVEWSMTVNTVPGAALRLGTGTDANWTGTADTTGAWTGLITQQYLGMDSWMPLTVTASTPGYESRTLLYDFPSTATETTPGRVNATVDLPLTPLPLRRSGSPVFSRKDLAQIDGVVTADR